MPELARAPFPSGQTLALIESSPLNSAAWETLADKIRGENDPLSVKSLKVIIRGLRSIEQADETAGPTVSPDRLSELSQSMFVRLARAYNSPTLLKEVGLIYLRDLSLPAVALEHFERSLILGGPEKELRPLTEAAAVAVQRQIARQRGEEPQLSGMTTAHPMHPVATTIIRRTGKMLLPTSFGHTGALPRPTSVEEETEAFKPMPEGTEACLAEAGQAIQRGSLPRAEALLRKAAAKPAEGHAMWQAWTNLGQAAFERGDYARVETAFAEALPYQPSELAAHFNAALGHQLNRNFEKALVAYTKANELEGGHPKVGCNLGALYFQMDDYVRAEEALRGAVAADGDYARAWDNLAASLGAQDKLDEALAACEKTVGLRSEYPEARFKMGVIYFSKGDWDRALEEFARAALLPSLAGYCEAFLAMIYARLGQPQAAESAIRRATQIDAKCDLLWMAWNDLGLARFIENDYARAASAYQEAALLKPDEASTWFNLGVSYHQAGDLRAARDSYQHAVDLKDSLSEGWHNLGTICAEMDDLPAALIAFQRETSCAPANMRAWYDLGVAFEKTGDHAQAKDAFGRADSLASRALAVDKQESAKFVPGKPS